MTGLSGIISCVPTASAELGMSVRVLTRAGDWLRKNLPMWSLAYAWASTGTELEHGGVRSRYGQKGVARLHVNPYGSCI